MSMRALATRAAPALTPAAQRARATAEPTARAVHARLSNQNIQQLLLAGNFQPRIEVSPPNDPLELEADHVADIVLRMSLPANHASPAVSATQGGVQCQCAACEEERLLRKEASEPMLPRKISAPASPASGRQPLPAAQRAYFEPRLGCDLGAVRVHAGLGAARCARSLCSLAFTHGQDIYFGSGQYAPETMAGRRLLAHELVHTIQQRRYPIARETIMRRWDPANHECDAEPQNKWIEKVMVEQEEPQSVTLHWSDGSLDAGRCSTGKGHCCVDATNPDSVVCSVAGSAVDGSNCTQISTGPGFAVRNRYRSRNGWDFWTDVVPARGIGLHRHPRVDGSPLSHGCVRLEMDMARKIWCGVRQNRSRVQVRGFARPRCDWPQLVDEWARDFDVAATPTDGENVTPEFRRTISQTRDMIKHAFGVGERGLEGLLARPRSDLASLIPRCRGAAPRPTPEEARLTEYPLEAARRGGHGQGPTVPALILAATGFHARFYTAFLLALSRVGSMRQATHVVRAQGRALWQFATRRAQRATRADLDDRALYWERLEMARALHQWQPRFRLTDAQRDSLVETFELAARGMDTAAFARRARGAKRILVSGFDPFGLVLTRANPSGAAVLALDGQTISNTGVSAQIQGVIFPVRFTAFDTGLVERFFRPFVDATTPVDMIMTISMGGGTAFEVEQYAGRRRSSGSFLDNLRRVSGGTPAVPVEPPGLTAGSEFLPTALPATAIRTALGRSTPLRGETQVTEIPLGGTAPVPRPTGGPSATSIAVEGSGGGFLSNEIMYRTLLLRRSTGASIPVGHLHTPLLEAPLGGITDPTFVAAREGMVATVRRILVAALPSL